MGEVLDERTKNYFEKIKNNIGYLGSNAGWYSIEEILKKEGILETAELEQVGNHKGFANTSNFTIYKYKNKGEVRYCAEYGYQTDIDDYCIETHIFDRLPSLNNIHTIIDIGDLEFMFKYKRLKPEFTCWECGRRLHWLDNDGDLPDKKGKLLDKYCGC